VPLARRREPPAFNRGASWAGDRTVPDDRLITARRSQYGAKR